MKDACKNSTSSALLKPHIKEKQNTTPAECKTPTPLNPGGRFPHLTFFCTFTITCLQSRECSFPRDFSLFYYDQWQRAFVRGVHNSLLLASKWTFQLHIWSTSISSSLTESYSERKPPTSTSKGGNLVILSFFFFFLSLARRCFADCLHWAYVYQLSDTLWPHLGSCSRNWCFKWKSS